jgi:DNA-binding phage protein
MNNKFAPIEEHWQINVLLLKKIAERKGMSQYKIAELTGFTQSNINRIFALKFCPNLRTFIAIARALECNFYIESRDSTSIDNTLMEEAMTEFGRRPDKLPKN